MGQHMPSLVGNHALVDGNKRIGWLATVVFYGLNDIRLDAPDDDAYDLVIAVATGTTGYRASPPGTPELAQSSPLLSGGSSPGWRGARR